MVVLRVPLILKYHFNKNKNCFVTIYSIIPLNITSDLSVPSFLLAFDCFKSCSKQPCGYRLKDLVVPEEVSDDLVYPWMVVSFC